MDEKAALFTIGVVAFLISIFPLLPAKNAGQKTFSGHNSKSEKYQTKPPVIKAPSNH